MHYKKFRNPQHYPDPSRVDHFNYRADPPQGRRNGMTKEEHNLLHRLAAYLRKKEILKNDDDTYSHVKLLDLAFWLEGNCKGKLPVCEHRSWDDWA